MLSYEFKTYLSNGREHYFSARRDLDNVPVSKRSEEFPQSLISFLYLDMEPLEPVFKQISDGLWSLTLTGENRFAEEAKVRLASLSLQHVYFEFVCLDWSWRIDRAGMLEDYTENLLHRQELLDMAGNLKQMQGQIEGLIAGVLDTDGEKAGVEEKLTAYYKAASREKGQMFQFRPQPVNYELMNDEVFTEVLCPNTIYDLIDYHLRECVKRGVKMRRCRNCGRYFALTGHLGAEYCGRPFDGKGRSCKELGAAIQWTMRKRQDAVFTDFRREYKKRFAWIRRGKLTQEEFRYWSAAARKKRKDCETGKISAEEFSRWLEES